MLRMNAGFAIGVDCEETKRFENMNKRTLERIFTKKEIEYCMKKARPAQHFAVRFAAKEAIIKCFGNLGKRVLIDQIEISKRPNGAPQAKAKTQEKYEIRMSMSHSGGMAIAFAAVELKYAGGRK